MRPAFISAPFPPAIGESATARCLRGLAFDPLTFPESDQISRCGSDTNPPCRNMQDGTNSRSAIDLIRRTLRPVPDSRSYRSFKSWKPISMGRGTRNYCRPVLSATGFRDPVIYMEARRDPTIAFNFLECFELQCALRLGIVSATSCDRKTWRPIEIPRARRSPRYAAPSRSAHATPAGLRRPPGCPCYLDG